MAFPHRHAPRDLRVLIIVLMAASSLSLDVKRPCFSPFCSSVSPTRCNALRDARWIERNESLDKSNFMKHGRYVRTQLALVRGGSTEAEATKPADDITTPDASNVLSYYLLWSPGVLQKTVLSILVLVSLRFVSMSFQERLAGLAATSTTAPFGFVVQFVILPLLGSACCGLQLAMNAFVGAGGCAGFNKILGPLRPHFIAILVVATATTFPTAHQSRSATIKWIQYSLLRWSIALMPEMVHLWNIHVGERIQRSDKGIATRDEKGTATIELVIPSMGCVACINKIDSSLRQCAPNQIEEAKSWLEPYGKGGRALVKGVAATDEQARHLAESLVEAVQRAGFEPCSIHRIQIDKQPES